MIVERFTGVRIDVEAWKVTARDVDAYTMNSFENIRGRIKVNRQLSRFTRREELLLCQ